MKKTTKMERFMTKAQISRKLAAWLAAYGEQPVLKMLPDGSVILSAAPKDAAD
ncbi:MAG: hypothetical protein ACQKBT_12365 [Puniceicoccales bacterium]